MKYIDAEKLRSEIERRKKQADESITSDEPKYRAHYKLGKRDAFGELLLFVGYLQQEPPDMGEVSDGYHTFNELYYYRMLYNAAFFNLLPKEWVHKSKRHHTGEECFGGGWFIVMANLPTGQVSNHYELKDWDLFKVPEKEFADEWDGHTPQEAAERIHKYLQQEQPELYKKDESLGSPDYERGFKHGRDYQTEVTRKYTDKDKVVAYLVDKGYPISTTGEIPTYQETFDMISNAIKYTDQQEPPDTGGLYLELADFLIRNDIQEDKAKFLANRIADKYGSKRYIDGLCDGLDVNEQEQPSLPGNLDEAANSYASKTECAVVACRGFKAGAEWMAGQGLISEGLVYQTTKEDTKIELNEHIENLEDCERVVVNIRKKQ